MAKKRPEQQDEAGRVGSGVIGRNFLLLVPAGPSMDSVIGALRAHLEPGDLIQAQRDYFGAHTYERIDAKGTFHMEWGMK